MSEKSFLPGMFKSHAMRISALESECPKILVYDYEVRSSEQFVQDGKVLRKSVRKVIHPQDLFSGYKASDFSLENVIAVGALDSLKEGYLGVVNGAALSDHMEGSIDNAISVVDSFEQSKVEPQNNE